MTDIADEIRKAAGDPRMPQAQLDPENNFRRVRAKLRGAVIEAHRSLATEWNEVDDRILDVVSNWLEALKGRG